uniref:Uncharacterized protein n=1 Tax=Rhipicephalus zambeziensis TaxID=60191 RepID=A0A224YR74_9ACAR
MWWRVIVCFYSYYFLCSAFDLLNSSNPVAAGFKAPLRPSTFAHQREVMEAAGQQLMELRLGNERLIAQDGRRMSVIAMAFTLKSVSLLAEKLFGANLFEPRTRYLLAGSESPTCGRS